MIFYIRVWPNRSDLLSRLVFSSGPIWEYTDYCFHFFIMQDVYIPNVVIYKCDKISSIMKRFSREWRAEIWMDDLKGLVWLLFDCLEWQIVMFLVMFSNGTGFTLAFAFLWICQVYVQTFHLVAKFEDHSLTYVAKMFMPTSDLCCHCRFCMTWGCCCKCIWWWFGRVWRGLGSSRGT